MITDYAQYLYPSAKWLPLLEKGVVYINKAANRVCWRATGRFADALYPVQGAELSRQLANLPLSVSGARRAMAASHAMSRIQPALDALEVTSTIGALASVANLAVSCAGFAVVLHRLSRIDGKLDDVLAKIDRLRASVDRLHVHVEALSVARMMAAAESLERAIAANSPATRRELATDARRLFQESRKLYIELWCHADPWQDLQVPLASVLELQGRYVAAAIGEIQAEFIVGDEGAFRHAAASCASELVENMTPDPVAAFRSRSDAACEAGPMVVAQFQASLAQTVSQLHIARATTEWTSRRLAAFADDMEMARSVGLEPWEVARVVQSAPGSDLYLLGPAGMARSFGHNVAE